jgi:simple sugar transport system substrate-binding protein
MKLYLKAAMAAAAALALAGCGNGADTAKSGGGDKMTVGFAQIGSESGWRAAETNITKQEAAKRGVDLKYADGQQRQENQIKAMRAFIAQGVDAIFVAPVVETGWDQVLGEAKAAKIPVVLLDRKVSAPADLYLTSVGADSVHEGKVAGEWLVKTVAGKPCRVAELQGTPGASVANDRSKGFKEAIAAASNITIAHSQAGDFTRAKAKEVMESFIKAAGSNKICAVFAHNDDMMIGAIQAMKEAGLKPGKDVLTISIDGVPDIFKAMMDGEANATVELNPNMAGPAFDALDAYKKAGTTPPKWIQTQSNLFLPDTAAAEYERRKTLYE